MGEAASDRGARRRLALPWLACLAGVLLVFHPSLFSGLKDLQLGWGDPRLLTYLFEHTWLWVTRAPLHTEFWSPPIMYPALGTGPYTDTILGAAPMYWAFRGVGFAEAPSMVLWLIGASVLNLWAAWMFLTRILGVRTLAATAGAFLFGFGITRAANVSSPQMLAAFYGMFGMVALGRALQLAGTERPGGMRVLRCLVLASVLMVLQAWSAFYNAFFYLLVLGVALAVALTMREGRRAIGRLLRRHVVAIVVALVVGLLLLRPLLVAQLGSITSGGVRNLQHIHRSLADLTSWIDPGLSHWLYGDLVRFTHTSSASQHVNGVGFVTMLVALIGLVMGRRRLIVRVAALSTAVVVVLMTRWPNGFSFWFEVVEAVPLLRSVRYSARIGEFLVIPAGIGLALVVEGLIERRRVLPAALLVLLCAAEQGHFVNGRPNAVYEDAIDALAAQVDPDCETFFIQSYDSRPADEPRPRKIHEKVTHIAAMWVGIRTGKPTINGNMGQQPRGWKMVRADVDPHPSPDDKHTVTQETLEGQLQRWVEKKRLDPERICRITAPAAELPWYRIP